MSGNLHVSRFLATMLTLWSLCTAMPLMAQSGVHWHTDFEMALREAARTRKPILVHIWASYCGPCKQMDRQVFSQANVAQAMHSQFVPVKLSAEDPEQVEYIKQWGVTVIPTDVVLHPNGQIAAEPSSGFFDSSTYVTRLEQLAAAVKPSVRSNHSFAESGVTVPVMPAESRPAERGYEPQQPQRRSIQSSPHPQFAQYRNTANEVPSSSPYRYEQSEQSFGQEPVRAERPNVVSSQPDYDNRYAAPQDQGYQEPPRASENRFSPRPEVATAPKRSERYPGRDEYTGPKSRNTFAENMASQRPTANDDRYAANQYPQASQPTPKAEETKPVEPPPLGLEGYCPVRLVEDKRWLQGDKRFGIIHHGQLYLFAGADEQRKFWENPSRYAPVAGGYDPVLKFDHGYRVPGTRKFGVFYQDRVHLFACEDTLGEFSKNPGEYTEEPVPQAAQAPVRSNRSAPRSYPSYR